MGCSDDLRHGGSSSFPRTPIVFELTKQNTLSYGVVQRSSVDSSCTASVVKESSVAPIEASVGPRIPVIPSVLQQRSSIAVQVQWCNIYTWCMSQSQFICEYGQFNGRCSTSRYKVFNRGRVLLVPGSIVAVTTTLARCPRMHRHVQL